MRLLQLNQVPILEQLQIEEALLRTTSEDWCLINTGSPPAIVMGISQDPTTVIHQENFAKQRVPVIRRFSGGGTVVVEHETLFVTFILKHSSLDVPPYPKELLHWTKKIYDPVFSSLPFSIKENDYALEERKCGGNAQYFIKDRVLHHTSFLWDYSHEYMQLLSMPPKMPSYRENRSHHDFLCTLKEHFLSKEDLIEKIKVSLEQLFDLEHFTKKDLLEILKAPHRKATQLL